MADIVAGNIAGAGGSDGAAVGAHAAGLLAEPSALIAAAAELDGIAERMSAARAAHSPVVHAAPAGSEEVSQTVARNQAIVADSFDDAALAGVDSVRDAAEALRLQAAQYTAADAAGGAAISPVF